MQAWCDSQQHPPANKAVGILQKGPLWNRKIRGDRGGKLSPLHLRCELSADKELLPRLRNGLHQLHLNDNVHIDTDSDRGRAEPCLPRARVQQNCR